MLKLMRRTYQRLVLVLLSISTVRPDNPFQVTNLLPLHHLGYRHWTNLLKRCEFFFFSIEFVLRENL